MGPVSYVLAPDLVKVISYDFGVRMTILTH